MLLRDKQEGTVESSKRSGAEIHGPAQRSRGCQGVHRLVCQGDRRTPVSPAHRSPPRGLPGDPHPGGEASADSDGEGHQRSGEAAVAVGLPPEIEAGGAEGDNGEPNQGQQGRP